jgi:MYXO-CTERM domain-containing protein
VKRLSRVGAWTWARIGAWALLAACSARPSGVVVQDLSDEVKAERYTLIRDTAAQMGVYNAPLLAGIAISETNLAHCWSEATYACKGPASTSCGGGPVIAGAADGPCSDMQGGLGMFQFDAGTYADTVGAYGPQILTIEGNSAQAVSFVIDKVIQDVPDTDDWLVAAAWMNQVPLQAGDPVMEQWAALLACRYNGCCSGSATCTMRAHNYRDNALTALSDMGAAFWRTADRCAALPPDGVIDERTACYVAGGDPRYWRHEAAGLGGTLDWTMTTAAAAPVNFGEWIVKTGRPGRYHVDVELDGGRFGQSTMAHYQIAHAGMVETVEVDQTSATGFVSLGDFDFAGMGDEHVLLGDNTGEPGSTMTQLAFAAIRVQPVDGGDPGSGGDPGDDGAAGGGCGCAGSGGGGTGGGALALAVLAAVVRRRRAG